MNDLIINFLELHESLNKTGIKFKKDGFGQILQNYAFHYISEDILTKDDETTIKENFKKSKIIIVDQNEKLVEKTKIYLIIGFEKTLIIADQSSTFINELFTINSCTPVCFIKKDNNLFNKINNPKTVPDSNFAEEIKNLRNTLSVFTKEKKINEALKLISACISAYLIKKSYFQQRRPRICQFINDFDKEQAAEVIYEKEYVELREIGAGSSFFCNLAYHIPKETLCVIKNPISIVKSSKLIDREAENYSKIRHPFIPKYYGKVNKKNCIVIEFICGQTLDNIKKMQLSFNELLTVIFELMMVIKYFHDNNLIYRDLKPNNDMIDENKTVVLIDFDNLILDDSESVKTLDIGAEKTSAPEFFYGLHSKKSDIYSLGKVIDHLMNETENRNTNIMNIINECTNNNAENRPNIDQLIQEFISYFQTKTQIENSYLKYKDHYNNFKIINKILSKHDVQFYLGFIHLEGKYVTPDIDKAIYYYLLAAEQNDSKAQLFLGVIYSDGKYITRDINKAIHYYSLAADQNIPEAQLNLGIIYSEGKYVTRNIDKTIHYYSLAADQNDPKAQFFLGEIYDEGIYVACDINKAIHYYSLAANQNHPQAQFNLGVIYDEGKYVKCDINKAIHYYSLAANQNNPGAQFNLGSIYYEGKYVTRDINKAIHYFSLVANQNDPQAQLNLGVIYHEGKYVECDINKAIYYYSLAADHNFPQAQFNLGVIYYDGKYATLDINKAIHYLSLAANKNHPQAQFYLGTIYNEGIYITRDISKAIHYYSLAANQNFLHAQFLLGVIYSDGKYVTRNIDKAIHYYSLAANQNHPLAQFCLGLIYHEGKYVMRDISKAIHYYSLAENQNHPRAQLNLGLIYHEGKYVARDINKAIIYYSLAANQNDPVAQFNLGVIYSDGKYVTRDINKAIHYYSLAANQKYSRAQFNLGVIYHEGTYVTRDIYNAIHYYSLAANKNLSQAQFNLGVIYDEGKYVTHDINKAIYYYSLAANQNHIQAQLNLGFIYHEGKYIIRDIEKAIHYYSLAANQMYSKAQFNLGVIYDEGKYVKCDINKAIHYYTLAANQNHPEAQFNLGIIYWLKKDFKKGRYYIMISSQNEYRPANFSHGFLLHEGKYIKRNIEDAIHYYKEASSFRIEHAKNNLGIIYKYGYNNVEGNAGKAIEYFEEAIHQKQDYLSMYNLAHIYIYSNQVKQDTNKSIELLINSSEKFIHSFRLLCLVIIKHFGFNFDIIKQEILKRKDISDNFLKDIFIEIKYILSFDKSHYEFLYESYRKQDFVYNIIKEPISTSDLENINKIDSQKNLKAKDITAEFYNGFGQNLLE